MSTPDVASYVDLDGRTHLVGFLWIASERGGSPTATFRYAESWLEHPSRFAIDPLLEITSSVWLRNTPGIPVIFQAATRRGPIHSPSRPDEISASTQVNVAEMAGQSRIISNRVGTPATTRNTAS